MGMPQFYSWLMQRYPRSVCKAVDKLYLRDQRPFDPSEPNPNGAEFDNLYLDMNGIIHPCFHPEVAIDKNKIKPKSYDEVFQMMFIYIDKVFSIVRPRKLLYLAIDGVAPRAKMNQQRVRRFKSNGDVNLKYGEENVECHLRPIESDEEKLMDSNVITPGTEFMELLSAALQYYVQLRMNTHPAWAGLKVILSDSSVPGEGEHKILAYIRSQRNSPGYDPNTRHCLYGMDADLIILSLATHEMHISILREETLHDIIKRKETYVAFMKFFIARQIFEFFNIWVLREYLEYELREMAVQVQSTKGAEEIGFEQMEPTNGEKKVDLERFIDDFICICLFVGNDFLPHLPSLVITEGAIDVLLTVYKEEILKRESYLTNGCEVNLKQLDVFLRALVSHENGIFTKRWKVASRNKFGLCKYSHEGEDMDALKERYYTEKYGAQTEEDRNTIRRGSVNKYIEGIFWIMKYYYQGVPSWHWFYPYHYAPFASDFDDVAKMDICFSLGKPFKPLDQLMAVLPATRELMVNASSPILDFYPHDVTIDLNGKKHDWQGVYRLPFIDEPRLLSEIAKAEHTLTDEEKRRNSFGKDMLFVHVSHPLAVNMILTCERNMKHPISQELSDGLGGCIYISVKSVVGMEIYSPINGMELITENNVVYVYYDCPPCSHHISKLLNGVIYPGKALKKKDMPPRLVLWHKIYCMNSSLYSGRLNKYRFGWTNSLQTFIPNFAARNRKRIAGDHSPDNEVENGCTANTLLEGKETIDENTRKKKKGKKRKHREVDGGPHKIISINKNCMDENLAGKIELNLYSTNAQENKAMETGNCFSGEAKRNKRKDGKETIDDGIRDKLMAIETGNCFSGEAKMNKCKDGKETVDDGVRDKLMAIETGNCFSGEAKKNKRKDRKENIDDGVNDKLMAIETGNCFSGEAKRNQSNDKKEIMGDGVTDKTMTIETGNCFSGEAKRNEGKDRKETIDDGVSDKLMAIETGNHFSGETKRKKHKDRKETIDDGVTDKTIAIETGNCFSGEAKRKKHKDRKETIDDGVTDKTMAIETGNSFSGEAKRKKHKDRKETIDDGVSDKLMAIETGNHFSGETKRKKHKDRKETVDDGDTDKTIAIETGNCFSGEVKRKKHNDRKETIDDGVTDKTMAIETGNSFSGEAKRKKHKDRKGTIDDGIRDKIISIPKNSTDENLAAKAQGTTGEGKKKKQKEIIDDGVPGKIIGIDKSCVDENLKAKVQEIAADENKNCINGKPEKKRKRKRSNDDGVPDKVIG